MIALLVATGCGASHATSTAAGNASPSTSIHRTTVRPARQKTVGHALTEGDVLAVPLRTPLHAVVKRLGSPSAHGPQTVGRYRCLYWRIVGQPADNALWRLCFASSRLVIVSTYLH